MSRKIVKRLKLVLYNIVVVFLLLCGIEWYFNYKLNNPESIPTWLYRPIRSYYHAMDCNMIQMDPNCAHYSTELFYELNPGEFVFSNREFSNRFKVNSKGFRDDEVSLDYPQIVVLGDSYAMGWGVEQEETFAQIIEKELGQTVLNTGVSSYGTAREVASLEKVNTDSLKLLIVQYCPNDLLENREFVLNGDSLIVSSEKLYNHSVKLQQERTGYYWFKHLVHLPSHFRGHSPGKKVETDRTKKLDEIPEVDAFLQVLNSSKKIPLDTKIIVFMLEAEHSTDTFVKGVQEKLNQNFTSSLSDRISTVDLTGKIGKEQRYILDPHLNSKGHQVVAQAILEHIPSIDYSNTPKLWYYDSGDTMVYAEYQNGVKHGVFKAYWEGSNVSRVTHFIKGSKEGKEVDYYQNGSPSFIRNYTANQLVGWSWELNEEGQKVDSLYHGAPQ